MTIKEYDVAMASAACAAQHEVNPKGYTCPNLGIPYSTCGGACFLIATHNKAAKTRGGKTAYQLKVEFFGE